MGYDSEIKARLGVDTSSVAGDLANASRTFDAWGKKVAATGGDHGGSFGDKFTGALEHRLLGTRHLAGAVATALGLNIEKIADSIAGAIVGGTKEGWEEAGRIADENTKRINAVIEKNRTPEQNQAFYQREIDREVALQEEIARRTTTKTRGRFGYSVSKRDLTADELKEQGESEARMLDFQAKLEESKKSAAEKLKKTKEEIQKEDDDALATEDKLVAVTEELAQAQADLAKGQKSEQEHQDAILKVKKLTKEQTDLINKAQEEITENTKKEGEYEQKKIQQAERMASLQRDREEQTMKIGEEQAKIDDKSKLTIAEIANLHARKNSFQQEQEDTRDDFKSTFEDDQGLSQGAIDARNKARQIQRLEAKAENARLSGDREGAMSFDTKVADMRKELVDAGYAKSTESPDTKILQDMKIDQAKLVEINTKIADILKGKFVSQ